MITEILSVISGSHAYGFPSATSDVDVRKVHAVDTESLYRYPFGKSSQKSGPYGTLSSESGLIEVVSHEVGKFVHLLSGGNVTMYEMLMNPHIAYEYPLWIDALRSIARQTPCRSHVRHHTGLAESEFLRARRDEGVEVKGALYAFRGLLAAVAVIESPQYTLDIQTLAENAAERSDDLDVRSVVNDLVERRKFMDERESLSGASSIEREFKRLNNAVADFYSSNGAWLRDRPSQSVTDDLTHWLVEFRKHLAEKPI